MDSTTKRLLGAGLNTMSMVAFAIPGGAPIGVLLMAFDALFEALTGEPPPVPPGITRSDLKAAFDKVKNQLTDAQWRAQVDKITYQVMALSQGQLEVQAAIAKIKMDGDRYTFLTNNDTVAHFVRHMDSYFDMTEAQSPNGILTQLRTARYFLELKGGYVLSKVTPNDQQIQDHQVNSFGLYYSIGSLTATYLKTAILWNWGQEMLAAWQYQQYLSDLAKWDTTDPDSDPKKKYPASIQAPGYTPPSWETWTTEVNPNPPPARKKQDNCPANILIQEVQEMLDYCVGSNSACYTTILTRLNDLDAKATAAEATLPAGTTAVTLAQMQTAGDLGAAAAGYLNVQEPAWSLLDVDGAAIADFAVKLDTWRSAQASAMFHTHKATAGESLTDIAAKEYPNQDPHAFAQKLYDANPGLKFDGPKSAAGDWLTSAIVADSTVKIFDLPAYPYLPVATATQGANQ